MKKGQRLILPGWAILLLAGNMADKVSTMEAQTPLSFSLSTSIPSPAPVGTVVTWTAIASSSSGGVWYRFRVRDRTQNLPGCRPTGSAPPSDSCAERGFAVVRDYGPVNTIDWTASEHEGDYDIEVSARDRDTGAVGAAAATFRFTPQVTGGTVVLTPTINPLVFLYSAPACPVGTSMRVQFQGTDGLLQSTNSKPCDGRRTMNFYLAGMRPQMSYNVEPAYEGLSGQGVTGSVMVQATSGTPFSYAARTVAVAQSLPVVNPIILQARFGWPAATDMTGNIIWYSQQDISMISRPEPGGLFLGWWEAGTDDTAHQILREFDLAGTVLRETNAARINEQLAAIGMHPITSFHHEIRGLPDGSILALAATERILTGVQGPGPVDVLGDMILVLDRNLQIRWAWDTFDHLDPHRIATQNETCTAVTGGCPPILLAPKANDWTHGNSLSLTPDGNILYSARHQDWVIKIDYGNGLGTGTILWRLGRDGDFRFISSDPYPWFSHQHDANLDTNGVLTLFDNGNLRNAANANAHSRGQVIQLDEQNRTATLLVNADLGSYSIALGAAQVLPDGTYHFHMGDIQPSSTTRIVEVDSSGNLVYDMNVGEIQYRSFRMRDLYTP